MYSYFFLESRQICVGLQCEGKGKWLPKGALGTFTFSFIKIPKNVKMYLHKKRGCPLKN